MFSHKKINFPREIYWTRNRFLFSLIQLIQFMSHRTTTIFFHNILHVTGQTLFVDCIVLWLTLRLWIRHNATGSLQHLDWRSSICYRSKETRRHCGLVESGGRTTGKNQASNTTQFISSQFHKSFKFNFMSNRCAELFFFFYIKPATLSLAEPQS